ncbi:TraB/VirB10 family protein, partial [Cysteiniphilum litorale]|uniref:TraB/VirB10 family protein n=3 Tax=Cysteiniphilum TaxID=2056696 RepID=UPI001880C06D
KKALEAQKQQMQQNQETQQWIEGVKKPLRGLSGSYKVGANGENETKPKDADRSQLPHGQSLSDLNYPDYHDNLNHGDIFSRGESLSHEQTEATPVVRLPVSFSKTVVEKESISKYIRTHKNYVPTGTFCEAILLGAAEAQAGVDAQGDASPIMFEVKNNCFLPNGKRSYLKGAFITASVYGRISSSRGMVRLEHLSLVRKDGSILDIGVEGTAFDLSGKNGIRGEFKLRNDKVIMNAGIAGLLSGLGESASQYSQTQSISPLGATSTIDASKILPNALGKGVSQSFGEMSKYYIEFAKQFQPTIDLRAGAKVNIVFLKGFPILDEARIRAYEQKVDAAREERMKQANMQNTQNMQVPHSPYLAQAPMTGTDEYGSGLTDDAQINPFSGDMLTQAGQARQVEAPLADGLV